MIKTRTQPLVSSETISTNRHQMAILLEWRIVGLAIIAMIAVTSLPYIYGYISAPADRHYIGLMMGVPDHLQYFSWMRDLSKQSLASNRLTSEPNDPAFFNLLWWSVGRLGALTHLDYPILFQILRVLAIALCLSSGYAFFQTVIAARDQRRLAFLIFVLGGGFGVLWVIIKYLQQLSDVPFPDDIYTAEANTFFISLAFPHFTMATALLTATFTFTLLALREQRLIYALGAGIVAMLLGLQHTYDLIIVYTVMGMFGALVWIRDRRFPTFYMLCGLCVALLSGPPSIYMFLLVKTNPVWGAVLAQFGNAGVFTPALPHIIVLMGLPLWLALIKLRPALFMSQNDAELFVAVWFVAYFGLIYIPTDFQIHMLLGWQIPTAVFASKALYRLTNLVYDFSARISVRAILGTALLLMLLTNIYILGWRFVELRRHIEPYYISQDQRMALDWLEVHTTSDDIVFAPLAFGQFVPMWSDARAFLAHWANTLDFYGKVERVEKVFDQATPPADRNDILRSADVDYVIITSPQPVPWAGEPNYQLVFHQGEIMIYQVDLAPK